MAALAGAGEAFPAASRNHARTVFTPSPLDSVSRSELALVCHASQLLPPLTHTCLAVPLVVARAIVTEVVFVYMAAPLILTVPVGPGVDDPADGGASANAAARSSRGFTYPLRASMTLFPLAISRVNVWSTVSEGNAARSTATAPATCGVACDVPDMVIPAAAIATPGASMVRNGAAFEKHATLSAAEPPSLQTPA